MSDAVMTYNQFIESRRLMLGEEEFKKWPKVRRQLAYKSYLSISPFPRRRRKVDAESIYIDSEIAHNRRSAVTTEELSEEALYKLLAELEQNQSVTFDMIPSDKDEIVGAILSRFRIPKAIVWPEKKMYPPLPFTDSVNGHTVVKYSSTFYGDGYNNAIDACKAAVEKAKGRV